MMRGRRRSAMAALLAVITAGLTVCMSAPAQAVPEFHPMRLPSIGDAKQVVVVTAGSWRSTTGTLRTYERIGDQWRLVLEATPADLGYGGLVPAERRLQGTGTTPTGTFAILDSFGRSKDPGTLLDYRRVDGNDAWTYNPRVPATYNLFQDAPVSWKAYGKYVEMLDSYGRQYDYVAVLDYNLPDGSVTRDARGIRRTDDPADTRAGGGIFLHVTAGRATAGCVAIPRSAMKSVMQWLDPAKSPVLVVGRAGELNQT